MANKFRLAERRHVYTTPKSFLELLKLYSSLLGERRIKWDVYRNVYASTRLLELLAYVTTLAVLTITWHDRVQEE